MKFMKRWGLFIMTNLAILVLINIVLWVLEHQFGIQIMSGGYGGLLLIAFIFGFAGAFINLWISRWMAKRAYGIKLIDSSSAGQHPKLQKVYTTVTRIAQQHNIDMPEVGYYQSKSPNAFATGPTKNKSLVAVSTGLLSAMSEDEIEGVVAHEMAHVLNGDMVTMTLLQGVLNTFVIFFARVIAGIINGALRDAGRGLGGFTYFGVVLLLDLILGLLASIILMWYSRKREYAADAGSAEFVGSNKMIAALQKLKEFSNKDVPQDQFAMMKINGGKVWYNLYRSHPPLDSRIKRLQGR